MTEDPEELIRLMSASGALEATMVKTTLEGAGIFVLLQGLNAASIDTRLAMIAGVPVLVKRRDFVAAKALLDEAQPVADAAADPLEGAVCPVHEQPATGTCDRCGTFLCAQCRAVGSPPICESCVGQEAVERRDARPRGSRIRWIGVALVAVPLVVIFLTMLATAVMSSLR